MGQPKLFIDTWGWLTLRDKKEARHREVSAYYDNFFSTGGIIYTTDYVLDETFTLLFRRLPFSQAKESMELIFNSAEEGDLIFEFITPERFSNTRSLRIKFDDKPKISFTDFSSMVLMEELGISQILTSDAHFTHVGKGFQIIP